MNKFKDEFLQVTYDDMIEMGYDPMLAYLSVLDIQEALDSPHSINMEDVLNITDRMLEEDATHSG